MDTDAGALAPAPAPAQLQHLHTCTETDTDNDNDTGQAAVLSGGSCCWLLSLEGTCRRYGTAQHPNVMVLASIGDALVMNSGPGWDTLLT